MTDNNTLEVPADMVKSPLDEVVFILSQARIDLEERGYKLEDVATAFVSVGVNALTDAHGERATGRELYVMAMDLARKADAVDSQPKH
jgi:hypothetical protein